MNFTRVLATASAAFPSRTAHSSCCKRHWLHARYYSKQPLGVTRFVGRQKLYFPPFNTVHSDPKVSRSITNPNSIFAGDGWDHMFSNLDDYKARSSPSRRELQHARPTKPLQPQGKSQNRRPQAMTARELRAFDDAFSMIFYAASKVEGARTDRPSQGSVFQDVFPSIRTTSRGMRRTTEQEELLDRKTEEIDLCANDLELLHWTQREVLDPLDNFRFMLRRQPSNAPQSSAADQSDEAMKDNESDAPPSPELQLQSYHFLVAHLMRTFRDKYRDPHLALALFSKVKDHSLVSYVFGCSTRVYNELIDTKWQWFRDLRGVHDAVEEMVVNGVKINSHTRKLIENVRHGVKERKAWVENMDVGGEEVLGLLMRLDYFAAKPTSARRKTPLWEKWKEEHLSGKGGDEWEFNKW